MKHSIWLKSIAFILAVCALAVTLLGTMGVIILVQERLYTQSFEEWESRSYESVARSMGICMAESFAARKYSGLTEDELEYIGWGNAPETVGAWYDMEPADWCYSIANTNANVLETNYSKSFENCTSYTFRDTFQYPERSTRTGQWAEYHQYYDPDNGYGYDLYLRYEQSQELTVKVWLREEACSQYFGIDLSLLRILFQVRYYLIAVVGIGLLLAVACVIYLCCAAGKRFRGDTPRPAGLNRLPLDVYAAGATALCMLFAAAFVEGIERLLYYSADAPLGWALLSAAAALGAAVCVVGFIFALAAQLKMPGCYFWKHSVLGWCWSKLWKLIRLAGKGLCKLYDLLPLIWKYLLIGVAMGFIPLWCFYLVAVGESFWVLPLVLSCLCDGAIVAYGAYAYGTVLKGAQKMAQGELHTKIDTKYLTGSYKKCAEDLNALADVAVVAAKKQMQSDHMKTELITNVSHDIKTPLTSIINYIDLLQKADSPEQSAQYLQVLDRQSQRLKKLIDDLMEISKATTGNLPVDIARVDAVEAVNQALGEFADKLAAQELTVVFHQGSEPVPVQADGRLTWRVLSNLLSNIVKYALPGTRVYVDLCKHQGQVEISLKNISREELNVSAEELTERFVRGDASRNTEGSGLGLNIAQSLMELQKGSLQLVVDGDLFKVTLTFPAVQ